VTSHATFGHLAFVVLSALLGPFYLFIWLFSPKRNLSVGMIAVVRFRGVYFRPDEQHGVRKLNSDL
jgi:hypothetical protein